ncbi:hypothetical protein CCAX7_20500 [Capsulimonas corticalis]|uniref:Uncharacterized protein n=1 Tax=Capsulimonas corticalis TaxID=2219043 RepID=A0A402D2H6_9BACT|nr:hypothetical protein [Capsulimonas corticalis]BDI29999.1 hypothetical protein CCAX7_20500 [Capsulimonas corticalis]
MNHDFLFIALIPVVVLVLASLVPLMTKNFSGGSMDIMRDTRLRLEETRREQHEFQQQLLMELRRHNDVMERQTETIARMLDHRNDGAGR